MKIMTLLAPITLALMATTSPSHADVQPATAGHVWPFGADTSCIGNPAWDAVSDTCTDFVSHLWIIPMQIDISANKEAFATMIGGSPGGGNQGASCQAVSIGFNSEFAFTQRKFNLLPTAKTIDLGILGVPVHGTLHFECTVENGASVMSVEFQ